jgi:putative ATP-dependent endonuclease of OLD family
MRLTHVEVANCSRVVDVSFDVRRHLVLIGPNGSGKSTLLRLISGTLSWPSSRLLGHIDESYVRDRLRPMEVRLTLELSEPLGAFADEVEIVPGGWKLNLRLTASISPEGELEITRCFTKPSVVDMKMTTRHLEAMKWTAIEASRNPDREFNSSRAGVSGRLLRSRGLGDDESAVREALQSVEQLVDGSTTISELRVDVAQALSGLMPGGVDKNDVGIRLGGDDQDPYRSMEIVVELRQLGDGRRPLGDQSDGHRALALLGLELLAAGDAGVTSVDEPEMHLHPRAQAKVAKLLAGAEGQRIVATHSSLIARCFSPEDVVAVSRAGARQLPKGVKSSIPKLMENWWLEHFIELLTCDTVVFVEGTSDEIFVRAAAAVSGLDLDELNAVVLNIGGANSFPNAVEMFGPAGFGLHLSCLVDEAETAKAAGPLGVTDPDAADSCVFVCRKDLEAEYIAVLDDGRLVKALDRYKVGASLDTVLERVSGNKNKVRAAAAVGEILTPDDISRISPISRLLDRIRNRS